MVKIIEFFYDMDYGIITMGVIGLGLSKKKSNQLELRIKKEIDKFFED